jgi:hypothetical protein
MTFQNEVVLTVSLDIPSFKCPRTSNQYSTVSRLPHKG